MNLIHPIIERVPEDFPLFIEKAEFDSVKIPKIKRPHSPRNRQ